MLTASPIARRCRHCGNPLFTKLVSNSVLSSPFKKQDPAIFCEVCDAPGKLPFQP